MKLSKSICLIDTSFPLESNDIEIFKNRNLVIAIGDYEKILKEIHRYNITHYYFINLAKNSLFPLLDYSKVKCRIEYGAIIRDNVKLKENCVILMGAVINIGASIGKNTMVDMNAVIGSSAQIGDNCHIGAGAVISGTMEPLSLTPVIIGDNTFIGANAVILEGITIGNNVIVGAGSIVTKNIPDNMVVYGNPARIKRSTKLDDVNTIRKDLRWLI